MNLFGYMKLMEIFVQLVFKKNTLKRNTNVENRLENLSHLPLLLLSLPFLLFVYLILVLHFYFLEIGFMKYPRLALATLNFVADDNL